MKVLIVDDSSTMRKLVNRTLGETIYKPSRVEEASDGLDAWNSYCNSDFDLILCDWNMPKMDGLTFVTKVRAVNQKVVIVMITTEGSISKLDDALAKGVDGYVVKPFEKEKLEQKLEKAFARRNPRLFGGAPASAAAAPARAAGPSAAAPAVAVASGGGAFQCGKCKRGFPSGKFCPECGGPLLAVPVTCSKCKATVTSGKFCQECGNAI